MNCEDVRSVTVRALAGDATTEEAAAAEAHAAGCATCRSEASEMAAVWRMMGAWDVSSAPDDAEVRLLARIDAQEHVHAAGMRGRRLWPAVAVAAAALAGVMAGFSLPRPGGPAAAPASLVADRPAYLLLLRRADATAPDAGPVFERMVAEYAAWRDGLAERGVLLASNLLDAATGVELRAVPSGVAVTDGVPHSASGEYVSGYYLVAAADLTSARELARTSPHLRYGGSIELRPVSVPPTPQER